MAKRRGVRRSGYKALFTKGLKPRKLLNIPRAFAQVRGVRFSKLVQRELARGLTMRLSRKIGDNPFKVITRQDLPPRLAKISEQDLIGLRARAERAAYASNIYQGGKWNQNLVELNDLLGEDIMRGQSNYIREQGGRASIGVDIIVENPSTGATKEFYHEFIVPEVSDTEVLENLISAMVERICDSPQFEYLCDQSSVWFDYDVTGISLVE